SVSVVPRFVLPSLLTSRIRPSSALLTSRIRPSSAPNATPCSGGYSPTQDVLKSPRSSSEMSPSGAWFFSLRFVMHDLLFLDDHAVLPRSTQPLATDGTPASVETFSVYAGLTDRS